MLVFYYLLIYLARYCMIIRKENHIVVTLFSIGIVLSTTLVEYSANGRPLVTVEKFNLIKIIIMA